jgi:hypothetical protein
MNSLFEPNPILLAFLAMKTTVYLPTLLLLAVVRAFVAKGPARVFAIIAIAVAVLGLAARFGPPMLGLSGGTLSQIAYDMVNAGGGMAILLAATVPMALSAILPERRWPVLDALHALLVAALFLLWMLAQ